MFKRSAWLAAALVGLAAAAVSAQQPAAGEKHPYEITPQAGAWCICVTCFFDNFDQPRSPQEMQSMLAGSTARKLAIGFVTELRSEYKLPAYMFNRGDEERKKEEQRVAEQRERRKQDYLKLGAKPEDLPQMIHVKRLAHVQNQYVVLIGGYSDQETARRSLDAIRKLKAPSDQFLGIVQAGYAVAEGQKGDGYKMRANPFTTAMVVPNPVGPKLKPPTPNAEELGANLEQMNVRNPYSLLKHQGKWTLVVKMYRAPSTMVGLGESSGARVANSNGERNFEAMTKQSEQLAALLRHPQLNFESYVLHTNHGSLVTVGLFDSEKDPRLAGMQANLAKLQLQTSGGVMGEQLMSPPLPIPVPRGK